ncbi:MAG: DeoR family transcriptional regulator [Candidatus Yanofskybacteria bacterium]|nr:DeoR family transcriptional regulator [Candidatus Yanofskybacteria bacterium]
MEREDITKFINSIILLSKLFTTTEDRFLKQKLYDKLSRFVSAFVTERKNNYSYASYNLGFRNINNVAKSNDIVQRSTNVAQYHHQNLLNSTDNILDYLEYLAHISKNNTTPLLVAQRNLLKFKLHILQNNKVSKNEKRVSETSLVSDVAPLTSDTPRPSDAVHSSIISPAILVSKPSARNKPARLALKTDSNKEQIFNYVKKTPDVRTKEIMSEFSALSARTVKRNLKELADEGFLKKRSDGVAVYYTCG